MAVPKKKKSHLKSKMKNTINYKKNIKNILLDYSSFNSKFNDQSSSLILYLSQRDFYDYDNSVNEYNENGKNN